jgi:hypothetical protein
VAQLFDSLRDGSLTNSDAVARIENDAWLSR